MRVVVAAFLAGTVLGMTGAGPIAIVAGLVVGAFLLWRHNGEKIAGLEMADELAGYDPHEKYSDARRRYGMGNIPKAGE